MTLINQAHAAVPGVPDIDAALTELDRRLAAGGPPLETRADIEAEIRDRLLTGQPWPDQLGVRLLDTARAIDAAGAEHALIRSTRATLVQQRANLVEQNPDDALAVVAAALADLLPRVRTTVAAVGTVSTAEQAIDRGDATLTAWRKLNAQVAEYRSIRTAQWQIVKPHVPLGTYRWAGHIRGLDLIWSPPVNATTDMRQQIPGPPWPHVDPRTGDPDYAPDYLAWLVGTDADAWLPTMDELAAEIDVQNARRAERQTAEREDRHIAKSNRTEKV